MTLPQKLELLAERGEPLSITTLDPNRFDFDHALTLRTDRNDLCAFELDFTEHPDWWVEWQIIGALVSYAVDRGDLQGRDELLDAAKVGLHDVLDLRIRQLEIVEVG